MENVSAPWLRRLIVATLLAGLIVLAFDVLAPFIVPVVWAIIIAYVTWPTNARLRARFGGRAAPAAVLMTVIITAAVIVPIVWFVLMLRTEVVGAYHHLADLIVAGQLKVPQALLDLPVVGESLREANARMPQDTAGLSLGVEHLVDRSSGDIVRAIGGVGRNLGKLTIAMLSLYFMYRDGEALALQVKHMLEKFVGARVDGYLDAIGSTVKAVVYGLVLTAIAQGLMAAAGYWITGLPAPVFLGTVTALSALIPFVVPVMWGAASVWLLLTGKTAAAIGLALWGAIAVSWIDNVIRPLVISNATRIPFLLVLFGVLGGLAAFGLVGLFIGPVILAVLIAVWREWSLETNAAGPPGPPDDAA
jgi:predicted PurR-regulated permease PerM